MNPPIYVINMAKDVARMDNMARQLNALGLVFERVEAVAGRDLSAEQKRKYSSNFWFFMLIGRVALDSELGCALSHMKLWQMMLDRKQEWAVILEDDAELLPQFASQLLQFEYETRGYDMVHLYSTNNPDIIDHNASDGSFKVMGYSGNHSSTAAYMMRLSGAKKLNRMKRVWTSVDKWMWFSAIHGVRCCGIVPYPVKLSAEHSELSTIGAEGVRGKSKFWKTIISPTMRMVRIAIFKLRPSL